MEIEIKVTQVFASGVVCGWVGGGGTEGALFVCLQSRCLLAGQGSEG